MESNGGITSHITSGDKSVRGKICYPFTQPIWWFTLPVRWCISSFFGMLFGAKVQKTLWRNLTAANFLTSARFGLLIYALSLFFSNAPLARQTEILFFAIVTDFFDGPLARNNDEVTELGTYLDHTGDWAIAVWVFFLNFWYGVSPLPTLIPIFAVLPMLLSVYIMKFKKFFDQESSLLANLKGFAAEELQTDVWGRLQFMLLAIALFGGLFVVSAADPAFLFSSWVNAIPATTQTRLVWLTFLFFVFLGGYSTRHALDYSEAQAKKFREKLRQLKNSSSR